jgi:hypothetical protein
MVYFQTKNPNSGNLWWGGGAWNGKGWYITAIWYIFCPFGNLGSGNVVGIFSTIFVYCVKKNLANPELEIR